jgi:hypothetical protein
MKLGKLVRIPSMSIMLIFQSHAARENTSVIYKKELRGLSPQANYTDRLSDCRLSAKLVRTLADRGCRVVSATNPPQSLILVF